MRSNKVNYLVVGLFVLGMLAALIISIATLTGRTGAADAYYVVYENVTGVKFGTQVLYEGYPIGQVEEVTPMPEKGRMLFRVDINVKEGWKIPNDSLAKIAAPGLLAAVSVNIEAGKSSSELKPGEQIKSQESGDMFAVVSSLASQLSELSDRSLVPMLDNFNRAAKLFGDILEGEGKDLTKEAAKLVEYISNRAPGIVDNIQEMSNNLNSSSKGISSIFKKENQDKIENFVANMDRAAINFANLTQELEGSRKKFDALFDSMTGVIDETKPGITQSVKDLRHILDVVSRNIDSVTQNMDTTARNLSEFSRQIRKNPGLLL
ncbi:MAG: MlaD family protein, partial [Rhodospirillales bacterium]|nr:MlaD family protein [Rhodospirillales bacterium]